MSKDKKSNARRRVLKAAAGAGLVAGSRAGWESDKWARPVVESVLLPAHAQTSLPPGTFAGSGSFTASTTTVASPLDNLVESAYAVPGLQADLCIYVHDNLATAKAVINGFSLWQGTGALDSVFSLSFVSETSPEDCVVQNVMLDVKVKGTEPSREAYGNLSFDFGLGDGFETMCEISLPVDTYSGAYNIPETDTDCALKLADGPLQPCCF